jgi:hypothetical protein
MTRTSFHINGFWFHINWNYLGTMGIDQHGDTWYNKANPVSAAGGLKASQPPTGTTKLDNKDYFMDLRERATAFYINRQLAWK